MVVVLENTHIENSSVLYIPSECKLTLKTFGNETLLFHFLSGDTLLLSPTAVPIIVRLQGGSLEKQSLFEHVAEELNYELDESFIVHLEDVLSELMKRDIVATQ